MAWACRRRRSGTITATGSMAPERQEEEEQEEEEEPVAKRLKKTAVMVDKAAAAAVSERQGPSKFVGVSWNKRDRKWGAYINHEGNRQHGSTWVLSTTSTRRREPSTRRRGGCGVGTHTVGEQETALIGIA